MDSGNKIILHTCCGPCASACIERLLREKLQPVLFFSNSNIDTEGEYGKRLEQAKRLAEEYSLELKTDPYDHDKWLSAIRGLESEPEKGGRCLECFRFSLRRTAEFAGGEQFATSLTVSPHKRSADIFAIGGRLPGFQPFDFKKQNGFRRSLEISGTLKLYRQNYCGCEFSR